MRRRPVAAHACWLRLPFGLQWASTAAPLHRACLRIGEACCWRDVSRCACSEPGLLLPWPPFASAMGGSAPWPSVWWIEQLLVKPPASSAAPSGGATRPAASSCWPSSTREDTRAGRWTAGQSACRCGGDPACRGGSAHASGTPSCCRLYVLTYRPGCDGRSGVSMAELGSNPFFASTSCSTVCLSISCL